MFKKFQEERQQALAWFNAKTTFEKDKLTFKYNGDAIMRDNSFLTGREIQQIWNFEKSYIRCFASYGVELFENDYVDVQKDGIQKIYKKEDGQLYFKPYGVEDRVSSYFSDDMIKCDEVGIPIEF